MKIQFSLPSNGDFFNRYATLIPTLSKLGFIAQIISSITEIGIIYGLIYSRALEHSPTFAPIFAFIGAIIGTAFLEIGLRKFTPYSVRAFLYGRFKGLDLAMTLFILSINFGLLFSSGALSFKGSKEIVELTAPIPEEKKTDKIDNRFQVQKEEILKSFISDTSTLVTNYQKQIEAKENYYLSLIGLKESQIKNYIRKEERTGKSYSTRKESLRGEIQTIKAKKATAIGQLEKTKTDELKQLISERKNNIQKAEARYINKESTIQVDNQAAKEKANSRTGRYGNLLAYFTIICLFIFVVSVALDEINKKGSGIEQIAIPNQYHFSQPIFSDFANMVFDKWNYHSRTLIKSYSDKTPTPPLPTAPPILYNMGEFEQPKINVELEGEKLETIYLTYDQTEQKELKVEPDKIEQQILDYTKASSELKKANLLDQAKEMQLKANEVIKTYLEAQGRNTPKEVKNLRNAILKYLSGESKNPFEIDRQKIGFKFPPSPSHTETVRTVTNEVLIDSNMRGCVHCGNQFLAAPKHKRFCSDECRKSNWKEKNGRDPMMKKRK